MCVFTPEMNGTTRIRHQEPPCVTNLALNRKRLPSRLQDKKGRAKAAALPVRKPDGSWVLSEEPELDEDDLGAGPADEQPEPPPEKKGKENKRAERKPAGGAEEEPERDAQPRRKAPGGQPGAAQEPPQTVEQRLESIASLSTALIQAPEQNVAGLRALLRLVSDPDPLVARAASISTMLVFRDLAPGYRIRPPTEKEREVTVSKEVQQLRKYETAFLTGAPARGRDSRRGAAELPPRHADSSVVK